MNKIPKKFSFYTAFAMFLISFLTSASFTQSTKSDDNKLPSKDSQTLQPLQRAGDIILTDEDRAEIVNQVLHLGLIKKEIFGHKLLVSPIILSTKNIKKEYVSKLDGYKFELLTPDGIEKKAENEGAFLYLSFHTFKVEKDKVEVLLLNGWAGKVDDPIAALQGGGIYYEFSKESGKWTSRMSGAVVA